MAAKPKHQREKMEGYGAEEEFQREWRGERGHGWCRRVGGDRRQSRNNTTGEGKEEITFLAEVPALAKKTSKKCSPGECAWEGKGEK